MRLVPWLIALLLVLLGAGAQAQGVQPVPALTARVVDQTGTLPDPQRAALEAKLAALEARAGAQVVLLLVASTQPEDIGAYAQRVADTWKIGRRDVGDGVLVVIAKGDRRVRIEVAKALEGAIPDLAARQIIDNTIRPAFRADDYAGGLNAAVDAIAKRIEGEGLPAPGDAGGTPEFDSALKDLAIFFFLAVPVLGTVLTGLFGRRFGSLLTSGAAGGVGWFLTQSVGLGIAAGMLALVLVGVLGIGAAGRRAGGGGRSSGSGGGWSGGTWSGGSGGGSWGGGGGGGGGFSSGGGGDFGGGGASGDW